MAAHAIYFDFHYSRQPSTRAALLAKAFADTRSRLLDVRMCATQWTIILTELAKYDHPMEPRGDWSPFILTHSCTILISFKIVVHTFHYNISLILMLNWTDF